jgi:SPP1 family phage portal protein
MTVQQLYDLIHAGNIEKLKAVLEIGFDIDIIKKAVKQYDPKQHDVIIDKIQRPDKPIKDDNGNITEYKNVHRIAVPFQKQITLLRSAFVGIPNMKSKPEKPEQEDLLQVMGKIWHDNKMDYRFAETTKRTMSELRCAWLFYNVEDAEYWAGDPIKKTSVRPRIKLLSHLLGDTLLPVYDGNDDMIAFARCYQTRDFDDQQEIVTIEHLDIYTAERFYFKKQVKGVWVDNYILGDTLKAVAINETESVTFKPNLVGKIPVIYFAQDEPEWQDVQHAADRIDELISNHADTNDYFGNPILVGIGDTITLPQKGDAGKYVEIQGEKGDLKFVTWDNAPESIKMELTNLFNVVYDLSNTANVSFENMKGIGAMSGFAIQLMFLASTLKAKDKQMSTFGEGVQRAYNYMKKLFSIIDSKFIATLSFQITPDFASVLPSNQSELIDMLVTAKTGGIVSGETATNLTGLTENGKEEWDKIQEENNNTSALDNVMNDNVIPIKKAPIKAANA